MVWQSHAELATKLAVFLRCPHKDGIVAKLHRPISPGYLLVSSSISRRADEDHRRDTLRRHVEPGSLPRVDWQALGGEVPFDQVEKSSFTVDAAAPRVRMEFVTVEPIRLGVDGPAASANVNLKAFVLQQGHDCVDLRVGERARGCGQDQVSADAQHVCQWDRKH